MDCEQINIEFEKFVPKEEQRRLFSTVADKLHMAAPSDSHLKLVIAKGQEKFKGYCRIASKIGVFVAEACSSNPEDTLSKIEKEIGRQFQAWKRTRFNDAAQAG